MRSCRPHDSVGSESTCVLHKHDVTTLTAGSVLQGRPLGLTVVPKRLGTRLRLVAIRVSARASIGAGAAQQAVQLHRVVTQTQCQRCRRLRVGRDRRAAPRKAGVAAGRRRQRQQPRRHGPLLQPRRRRERAEVGASSVQRQHLRGGMFSSVVRCCQRRGHGDCGCSMRVPHDICCMCTCRHRQDILDLTR